MTTTAVHKSSLSTRWFMLLFGCTVMMGQYYTYDNPSALQSPLSQYFNTTDQGRTPLDDNEFAVFFNEMYTFYSLPNMFLPLFGGVLVDLIGARIMVMILISFVCAGQTLTALGISEQSVPITLSGRLLFGIGGETLSAAMSTVLAQWFKGRELAFAMGIQLSISRLGSVFNNMLSPYLLSHTNLHLSGVFYFGSMILCVSVLCSVIMFFLDRNSERALHITNGTENAEGEKLKGVCETLIDLIKDIRSYSVGFWLIVVSCVIVYGAIIPFNSISQKFLAEKFGFECNDKYCDPTLSFAMSIPFIISASSAPILGGLIDRIGCRAILILISSAVVIFVHTFFYFMGPNKDLIFVPLVFQGVAYSVYSAALWPSVAYVVEDRLIGTAYGITTAVQNIGLTVFPLIIGALRGWLGSYNKVEPFFALLGVIGVIVAIGLNIWDARNGHVLNAIPKYEAAKEPLLGNTETENVINVA